MKIEHYYITKIILAASVLTAGACSIPKGSSDDMRDGNNGDTNTADTDDSNDPDKEESSGSTTNPLKLSADCAQESSYSPLTAALEKSLYFGCTVLNQSKHRFTEKVTAASIKITFKNAEQTTVAVELETNALSTRHFYFPLPLAKLGDLSKMQATVSSFSKSGTFDLKLDFASIGSILTFDIGEMHDFGSQAIRSVTDLMVELVYAGDTDATIKSISGKKAALTFKGGEWPGTGGTCTMTIKTSCNVVLSFSPKSIGEFTTDLAIIYSNDFEDRTLMLTLVGEGVLKATQVLGQNTFNTNASSSVNVNGPGANAFSLPYSVFKDSQRLFVADHNNNRVLIWNSVPTSHNAPADIVLGQVDMDKKATNGDSGLTDSTTLSRPTAVFSNGTSLYVADSGNNRILIWDSIPENNAQAADRVLGQPDFTTGILDATSASSLGSPSALFVTSTQLIVADQDNHRVLIWNSILPASSSGANLVLGQPTFSTNTPNYGGATLGAPSNKNLHTPKGLTVLDDNLFVSDTNNHRIMAWSSLSTLTSYEAATFVLGQPNFTSKDGNRGEDAPTAESLKTPTAIFGDDGRLIVSDSLNYRVLIWNGVPTEMKAADYVFGQEGFGNSIVGISTNSQSVNNAKGVFYKSNDLYVADTVNNRVLKIALPAL